MIWTMPVLMVEVAVVVFLPEMAKDAWADLPHAVDELIAGEGEDLAFGDGDVAAGGADFNAPGGGEGATRFERAADNHFREAARVVAETGLGENGERPFRDVQSPEMELVLLPVRTSVPGPILAEKRGRGVLMVAVLLAAGR
jgi:hypothetical protein